MRFFHSIVFLFFLLSSSALFGQKEQIKSQPDKSNYNATIDKETGDTSLIVVYGQITERNCLFKISNVHVKYGKKSYYISNKDTDPFKTDEQGNYIIQINTYSQGLGLSFNYWEKDSYADFFVPVPQEWKGKQVKLDIGLKLMFTGGLDCF